MESNTSQPNEPKKTTEESGKGTKGLNDAEMFDFFNEVNINQEREANYEPPQSESPKARAEEKEEEEKEDKKDNSDDEEEIAAENSLEKEIDEIEEGHSACLISGDLDEVPEDLTVDVLQNLEKPSIEPSTVEDFTKEFPWHEEILKANKEVFSHDSFKENQLEVINATKSGRDVIAIMPTGSGKSLTFQLSAITDDGITFVIVPLLSLTEDQINTLKLLGINAIFFKGGMPASELESLIKETEPMPKLIYLTPEKLIKTPDSLRLLDKLHRNKKLSRFVIDEAHCISQWGKEFRRDYLELSKLKEKFKDVPILALTATATPTTIDDIIKKLGMNNTVRMHGKFGCPNIYFEVRPKIRVKNVIDDIGHFITSKFPTDCGILYCASRQDSEEAANILKTNFKIACDYYHGAMDERDKKEVQENWMNDKIKLITATTAFALGINKPNVRYIIHYSMPKSMEHYIQECGRAGRDGLPSYCLMYYDISDKKVYEYLLIKGESLHESATVKKTGQARIHKMLDYCEEKYICRRQIQFQYFGQPFNHEDCKEGCDNCKLRKNRGELKIFQKEAKTSTNLIRDIARQNKQITIFQAVSFLHGRNKQKLQSLITPTTKKYYGALKNTPYYLIRSIFIKLLVNRILREDMYKGRTNVLAYLGVCKKEKDLSAGKITIKVMVNNDARLVQESSRVVQGSRGYASPGIKVEDPFFGLQHKGRGKSINISDIKSITEEKSLKAIEIVLDGEKKVLKLFNKRDEKLLDKLFTNEVFRNIGENVPKDINELRRIVETYQWSSEEEQTFIRCGRYFLSSFIHHVETHILDELRAKEAAKEKQSSESSKKRSHPEGPRERPAQMFPKKGVGFL